MDKYRKLAYIVSYKDIKNGKWSMVSAECDALMPDEARVSRLLRSYKS